MNKDPEYYFERANAGNPIRSSLPRIISEAQERGKEALERSQKAKEAARRAQRNIARIGIIGTIAVVAAFVAIVYSGYMLVSDTVGMMKTVSQEINEVRVENISHQVRILHLEEEIRNLQCHVESNKDNLGAKCDGHIVP